MTPALLLSIHPVAISAVFLTFFVQRRHLLSLLLTLEALALIIVISIGVFYGLTTQANTFLILIILTFNAIEASLGLALLVAFSRTHGSDNIISLSPLKC